MMRRVVAVLNLCIVLILISGCSSITRGGAPEPSFDIAADLAKLDEHFKTSAAINDLYAGGTTDVAKRNRFIAGRLAMMNLRYIQFIRDLNADKQLLESASDISILGLNLAGAALGDKTTKTVLAAISAAVAGTRTSIDKNYFYEKTMPALVAAMNAERKKALIPILQGVRKSIDEYTAEDALTDLHTYYEAGTLVGAVNAVSVESAKQEAAANTHIVQLRKLQTTLAQAKNWISVNGAPSAKTKLKAWFSSHREHSTRTRAWFIILGAAIHEAPSADIVAAMVTGTPVKTAAKALLDSNDPQIQANFISTYGDITNFDPNILIDNLPDATLARIISSSLLEPDNILGLP